MNRPSIDWQIPILRYINRSMYGLALLGILDTVHLYVQRTFGFNKGCLGFLDAAIEQSFNCKQVVESEAGSLIGISNTFLGLAFYLLLAVLLFLRMYRVKKIRFALNLTITGGLSLAFIYAGYLVYYQYGVLGEYCLLCLISASIITLLVILEWARFFASKKEAMHPPSYSFAREIKIRIILAVAIVALGGADLLLANYQTPPPSTSDQNSTIRSDSLLLRSATSISLPATVPSECGYRDANHDKSQKGLISFYDPLQGTRQSSTSLILYFDPLHPSTQPMINFTDSLLDQWANQLEIAYKPVALSSASIPAVSALYAASQEDKFMEFLELLLDFKQEGLTGEKLLQQSARKAGLKIDLLEGTKSAELIRSRIYMEKEKARTLEIDHIPTLYINGRRIEKSSLSLNCILDLVEKSFHNN